MWSDSSYVSVRSHCPRLLVNILVEVDDVDFLVRLYQSFTDFIDPELRIIKVIERSSDSFSRNDRLVQMRSLPRNKHEYMPSLAILLFLHEASLDQYRTLKYRDYFLQHPWKLHHEDLLLAETTIETYPGNIQDYYETLIGYPLCGIRHIHYGKEHFRFTIFTSYRNWFKMVKFYKILANVCSDYEREDFCLLTVESFMNYDIQLVLKKLPPRKLPKSLDSTEIQFQISDLSSLIQFLPNICRPLSNNKWTTFDHDGNKIVFDVIPFPLRCDRTKSNVSDSCAGSLNRTHKGFYV